jgi:sugar lactone lactonase YvrE
VKRRGFLVAGRRAVGLTACVLAVACAGRSPVSALPSVLAQIRHLHPQAAQNLYVLNQSARNYYGSITVYKPGRSAPLRTLVGTSNPIAMAFDSAENLYVVDYITNAVLVYPPGAIKPKYRFSDGVKQPISIAIDASNDIYVGNLGGPPSVTVYAASSRKLLKTLVNCVNWPGSLATDDSGNLYVANGGVGDAGPFSVCVFGTSGTRAITDGIYDPFALALDAAGNLYVADFDNRVTVYPPGASTPSATLGSANGISQPWALAVDPSGNLYVANDGNNTVTSYAATTLDPLLTITDGISNPFSLAFGSYGFLNVANLGPNSKSPGWVTQYAPGKVTYGRRITKGVDSPTQVAFGP